MSLKAGNAAHFVSRVYTHPSPRVYTGGSLQLGSAPASSGSGDAEVGTARDGEAALDSTSRQGRVRFWAGHAGSAPQGFPNPPL